jgi:hypothetical protein
MFNKPLWLLIFFSFINYTFVGCTVVYTKQLFEVKPHNHIKKVTLTSGEVVRFDYRGGYLVQFEKPGIAGRTSKGDWVFTKMENVVELHRTSPSIIRLWNKKRLRNKKIIEVITTNSTLVRFDSTGGSYDDSKRTVKGSDIYGSEKIYNLKSTMGARVSIAKDISKENFLENKDQFIAEVLNKDQRLIVFDKKGGMFVEASNIVVGYKRDGSIVKLNSDQIDIVCINQQSPELSFFGGFIIGVSVFFAFVGQHFYDNDDENY